MKVNRTRPWLPGLAAAGLCVLLAGSIRAGEPIVKGYSDYEAYRREVESIGSSKHAALKSLGRTLGGREVFLLEISAGQAEKRPAVLIVGGVHPPHLVGSELAVRLARQLVDQAAKDKAVEEMLGRVTFYVIPRPSPDACEAFFRPPYYERAENERKTDDDHDGAVDEDGPDDLDGNGVITTMRVEDPAGAYLAHPKDPRVLIKADPLKNERGRWSLYVEGIDNDQDGELNEDPPGGTAFNRNFTFRYPYFQRGAGPHQVSEVETRAVADFAFSHQNIGVVFSFTPEDNLMHPWKPNPQTEGQRIKTHLLSADAGYLNHVAEQYREIHGGKDAPESPEGQGSFSEWAYFHYGRWSFGCRGWWVPPVSEGKAEGKPEAKIEGKAEAKPQAAGKEEGKPAAKSGEGKPAEDKRGAEELNALRWFAQEKIDGFVPWKRIEHPDFPGKTVEVGGFKPFLRLNPPAKELEPLAEKHWRFLRRLVELLPELSIEEAKVEPLDDGLWRVTATVVNKGFLPTIPEMGRISMEPQVLQIMVELPEGVKLVTGHPRVTLAPLAGNGGKAEQSWLLMAPAGKEHFVGLRVWSPAVGDKHATLKLTAKPNAQEKNP